MKFIEETRKRNYHMYGMFECPVCKQRFERQINKISMNMPDSPCSSCAHKLSKHRPPKRVSKKDVK